MPSPAASANQQALVHVPRHNLPDIRALAQSRIRQSHFNRQSSTGWANRDTIIFRPFPSSGLSLSQQLVARIFKTYICGWYALDRLGRPMYVELDFQDPPVGETETDCFVFFLQNINYSSDSTIRIGVELVKSLSLQSVYIPAEWAHPGGYFFDTILKGPTYVKALIIAFVGTINPIMCRCCIKNYLATSTQFDSHILTPFHACISYRTYMGGKCANCVWHNRSDCDWVFLSGYLPSRRREGLRDHPLRGEHAAAAVASSPGWTADLFNPSSCPRVGSDYPSPKGANSDRANCRRIAERSKTAADHGFRPF